MLAVLAVGAGGCVHAQAGPLIGVSTKHGPVVGLEAGAGVGMLSGTFGVEARPFGERNASFYVAGEPAIALPVAEQDGDDGVYPDAAFLSGGPTLGYSSDEHGEGAWMFGGFGGAAWLESGDCSHGGATSISIMFGIHVFVYDEPEFTFYGTPKIGRINGCPDLRISVD